MSDIPQPAGVDRYSTEIHLTPYNGVLTFLDSRREGEGNANTQQRSAASWEAPRGAGLDDEVPFGFEGTRLRIALACFPSLPSHAAVQIPDGGVFLQEHVHAHPRVRHARAHTEAVERSHTTLDNPGFCILCGALADSIEPDARKYQCEACDAPGVYGAEELLFIMIV